MCFLLKYFMMDVKTIFMGLLDMKFRYGGGNGKTIMDTICSSYDSFFESEKKIAKYMINHYDKVVDMTVGELAQASGSSEASVSRFCRKIGAKGFHH